MDSDLAEQIGLLWDWRVNQGLPFLANTEDVPVMRALLAGERLENLTGFEFLEEGLE